MTLRYWPPEAVQPTFSQISPPCGVNLMAFDSRLRHDLPHRALVAPTAAACSVSNTSWMVMPRLEARSFSRWWQSSTTCDQRHRFLVELVAAGLDARQVEDFVDQVEQMHAGIVDVGGIFLVGRHRVRAENLALHHFGKAEDGVERRAQLVAHLREEARLGDVGGFGAAGAPRRRSTWPVRVRRSARPFRRAPPASPAWSNAAGRRAARNSPRAVSAMHREHVVVEGAACSAKFERDRRR